MSQAPQLHWSSSSATHVGHVRQINEDAVLDRTDLRLWAVADGMGGHHAGDIASSSIIRILNETSPKSRLSAYVDEIEERILTINERLRKMAQEHEDNRTIGSTVVVMVALDQYCALLWAGDSRAYRLRDNSCVQLTRDHSQVEELIQKGLLLREDAEQHPASNIITRAVGASDDLYVDVDIEEIQPGDTFLLCSDGLYKHISDQEIGEFLKNPNIHEVGHGLVQLTLERGAIDNVSVVAIRAE